MDFDKELIDALSRRLHPAYHVVLILFFIIFLRLWDLQVIRGEYFFDLSENNRIRLQEIVAPRGLVYDRKGKLLVNNAPSFDISALSGKPPFPKENLPLLGRILTLDPSDIAFRVDQDQSRSPFRPIKIKTDVDRRELSLVEFYKLDLPDVTVEVFPKRNYPAGKKLAHILGYLGRINDTELNTKEYAQYNPDDIIGKSGIEKSFESPLRGRSGWLQFEVDALGRTKKVLSSINPVPGNNVYLTIDLDLQEIAEKALGENPGAVIAMDPHTGEILAFVSHPEFDPNQFSRGISPENWRTLRNNDEYPLTNRGIQGVYPPGSIFKIITAVAALEEGKVTPETVMFCDGSYWFGNRSYRCWKKGGHGSVNLYEAIEQSCDTYFYRLGHLVGIDRLAYYASLFGLGKPTRIALGDEKPGLIPTKAWKRKAFGAPWQEGETLSSAIGQSFVSTTPLQMLLLISAVANNGKVVTPQLVKRIVSPTGEPVKEFPPPITPQIAVSSRTLNVIQESLRRVVQSSSGTGKIARINNVELAGKTGTSQVVNLPPGKKSTLPPKWKDHAWFVAYAPFVNPRIAVVALVEHGGFGSTAAGPVAREIINYFLQQPNP